MTAEIVDMVDGLVQARTEDQMKSVGTWGNWEKSRGLDGGHGEGREQFSWIAGRIGSHRKKFLSRRP